MILDLEYLIIKNKNKINISFLVIIFFYHKN